MCTLEHFVHSRHERHSGSINAMPEKFLRLSLPSKLIRRNFPPKRVLFENAFQSGGLKNTSFAFQCGGETLRRLSFSKTTTSRTERELLIRFLGKSLVFKFLRPSVEGYIYMYLMHHFWKTTHCVFFSRKINHVQITNNAFKVRTTT